MSTRTRENAPAKEKRGTSPSNTGTAAPQRRRSPNPSKTLSPVGSPDSTPSARSIPNYLKPTRSSANDPPKQLGKKPVYATDSAANKPGLARRRSFDKPPSPSRTTRSPASPIPALRSASFSGKMSTSSQKGALERNLRAGPKDVGKQNSLYARGVSTVKKSNVLAKKHESGSGSSRKERAASPPVKVDSPNIHDVPEPEPHSDDQESFAAEGQSVLVGNHSEKGFEDSLLEDQEVTNIIEQTEGENDDKTAETVTKESPAAISEQHEANNVTVESPTIVDSKDDKVVTFEPSTVLEHQDAPLGIETKELEDKSPVEEITSQAEEIKEHGTDEMNNTNADESVAGDTSEDVQDKDADESVAGYLSEDVQDKEREEEDREEKEEEVTANKEEQEEEEVDSGSEAHESRDKEEQEVVEGESNEAEDATPKVAHGKKDVALSNDVIEETASKLREQRQNKVKALAGAFETVISLQEPK